MDLMSIKTETVSERWKRQYFIRNQWASVWLKTHTGSAQIIYDQIVEVEQSKARDKLDKIDKIIGNTCWTYHSCSECRTETREFLISLDVNGGEYNISLCADCLKKALKLLEQAK